MNKKHPRPVLTPICGKCGLRIYPAGSAGHSLGEGCVCGRPKPQPDPVPGGPDAEQLALFPPLPHRNALGKR